MAFSKHEGAGAPGNYFHSKNYVDNSYDYCEPEPTFDNCCIQGFLCEAREDYVPSMYVSVLSTANVFSDDIHNYYLKSLNPYLSPPKILTIFTDQEKMVKTFLIWLFEDIFRHFHYFYHWSRKRRF